MVVSDSFKDYVIDQLEHLGYITVKKMFGGFGLYHNGIIFGLLADDVLYFKVDDSNRSDYEKAGMKQYQPPFIDKPMIMPYSEVPVDILEDKERLSEWARKALLASANKSSKVQKGRKKANN